MPTYRVSAAPPTDADIVTRYLTLTFNGEAGGRTEHPPTTTDFGTIDVPDGIASVVVTLVDTDKDGFTSSPASVTFDTVPPAAPTGLVVERVVTA